MISDPRTSPDLAARPLSLRARGRAARALPRLLHADAAGALCGADRALAAHAADRPDSSGRAVRLDPAGLHREHLDDATYPSCACKSTVALPPLRAARRARPRRPPPSAASMSPRPTRSCSTSRRRSCSRATATPPPSPWRATTRASRRNSRVVIPVPTFIERKQIGVVDMKTIDHLDAYTAPRLVEYHDRDPVRADRSCDASPLRPAMAAPAARRVRDAIALPRRHRRGELRRRRIRRLDPVGEGERRARQLAQRQRLQDSGRRRAGARQLHQAEDAVLRRQGEPRPHGS